MDRIDEIRARVTEYEDYLKNTAFYAIGKKGINPRIKLNQYAYTDLVYLLSEVERINQNNKKLTEMIGAARELILQHAARAEKAEAERDAAVKDLYTACKGTPCNTGVCSKKNCTGNHIPCEFEWCGIERKNEHAND
jgi:hypothetical protein